MNACDMRRRTALLIAAAALAACASNTGDRGGTGSSGANSGGSSGTAVAVAGVTQPVEIVRDKYGVSHIYAQNQRDLFFAQGWNAARDRLWQLDLWRRQGEGKMAEQFGPRFVAEDRAARLFLFRGNLE